MSAALPQPHDLEPRSTIHPEVSAFLERMRIDPRQGMTTAQTEESRHQSGSNVVDLPPPEPWWKNLLEKFKENPIPILIAAALVSIGLALVQGHFPLEGIAILVAVALATGVGFINEYKSGIEYEKLKLSRLDVPVTVTRNAREEKVQVHDIVVGDIVHLHTGSKIPADCLLIHGESMEVNESRMTGEPHPVLKGEPGVRESFDLYGGTDVVHGTGSVVVIRVGNNSKWGEIARQLVSEEQEKTPLEERLDGLTEIINKVGTWAAILIFLALTAELLVRSLVLGEVQLGLDAATLDHFVRFFIVAVTIVVVAVPEGLPMAVNVSLAYSMAKITKEKNLVRKMVATETIGAANVICSDKTGTLTENKMTVVHLWLAGKRLVGKELQQLRDHNLFELLELSASVNSTAHLISENGKLAPDGNGTEGALLTFVHVQGTDYRSLRAQVPLVKRVPFSAEIKQMTSIVRHNGRVLALVKGAPERVLPLCTMIETAQGAEPIALHQRSIEQELSHVTGQAMRSLALAYKSLDDDGLEVVEGSLTLLALVGIADPMRENVPDAIRVARDAGIDVKMVTGDSVETARVLARQLGLLEEGSLVLEGKDFRSYEDQDLLGMLPHLRVLARAEPLDKLRLVNLLKSMRQVVAVTGDGTNDAPALKAADVGLAMGLSGTEVAKEASDIVLLDDNFGSIVRAVHWGRALYENIQKFIQFQLTVNVSALATAFLSPLLNVFLEPLTDGRIRLLETPLTVVQLLWVNLIMDTLAVLALCLDPPSPDTMRRPPVGRTEPFITRAMWQNIVGMGLFFTLVLIVLQATNFLGADRGRPGEFASVIFTTYVFFQVFNQFNCRSLNPLRSALSGLGSARNFLAVMALIVVVQLLLTQFGGSVFSTAPLSLEMWGKILALTSTALIIGEIVRFFRRTKLQKERTA